MQVFLHHDKQKNSQCYIITFVAAGGVILNIFVQVSKLKRKKVIHAHTQ